jgi:hypothetical protein
VARHRIRSLDPSDSETFPLPDHAPLKPANGLDWAWPADTENNSAAPTPAALMACPNKLEADGFILSFPIQIDDLEKIVAPHREFSVAAIC